MLDAVSSGMTESVTAPARRLLAKLPFGSASFDPVSVGVELINRMTGGFVARELCISKNQLERIFLTKHFEQHYDMMVGSLSTWRRISDWRDEGSIPDWVKIGESA